jgi:hypothetical protein
MTQVAYGAAFPASRGTLAPPVAPALDRVTGVTITGAWSLSRPLLTGFAADARFSLRDIVTGVTGDAITPAGALAFLGGHAGAVVGLYDHSGNGRTLTNATATQQPAFATGIGALSRAGATFDNTDDTLAGPSIDSFVSNTDGYAICVGRFNALTVNAADPWANPSLWTTKLGGHGVYARSTGSVFSYCYSTAPGQSAAGATISPATLFVHEWWHGGGQLYSRVNGGATYQVTCGSSAAVAGRVLRVGRDDGRVSNPAANSSVCELVFMSSRPAQADAVVADMMAFYGIDP